MQNIRWISQLSSKQRIWLVGTILCMGLIVAAGFFLEPSEEDSTGQMKISLEMSIKEIAPTLGVTGKALARELELPLDVSKSESFRSLGIKEDQLHHSVEHILSHKGLIIKYYIYAALVLGALVFLVRLGRPDKTDVKQRKFWYPRAPYILSLIIAVTAAGFLLGKSPNPMEGLVKTFKCMVGLYPDPGVKIASFVFFALLVLIGNKIICGWACPFGALEELIYSIPILKKIKKRKIPFVISNSIRALLFMVMLLFLFGIVGGRQGFVIYHFMNPFSLFDLDFESITILLTVIIALIASFFVYRPFCMFICPFGLVSWVFERISFFRVRIDKDTCTKCGACVKACPSTAAKNIVEGKKITADCFSCGRCLNKCPVDAIKYSFKK